MEIKSKLAIRNSKSYLITKRILDILGAFIGIIVLSPIYIIVAIAIKIEDPKGNVMFGHKRVGKYGKLFP